MGKFIAQGALARTGQVDEPPLTTTCKDLGDKQCNSLRDHRGTGESNGPILAMTAGGVIRQSKSSYSPNQHFPPL